MFVLSTVENLFFGFSFFIDFSPKKQIYNRHFLPNVVKKMCLNCSPSQIFLQKNLTKQFFLFGRIFLFSFFLFSSICEKHCCEQIPFKLFIFWSFLWKELFCILKMNFSSLLTFFSSFFVTFCFCSSRFAFSPLHFPLRLIFYFLSFCSHICSSAVSFFLFVFSRFSHICFPFPSFVCSVHNLSEEKFMELLRIWKNVCLFPYPFLLGTCFTFICLCMFVFVSKFHFFWYILICFWTFVFFCSRSWMFLPLLLPFYVSLFWDTVWFDHRFSHLFDFLLLHIFSHKDMFLYCFRSYSFSF